MMNIEQDFIYFTATDAQAKKLDAIWVKSKNMWKLPNTLGALRELHKEGFDVCEYGKRKAEARERLLKTKNHPPAIMFDVRLRPYQQQDINFLSFLPNAGVFNDPRTGKSITTLKLCEAEKRKKNLIVCPASLVINWANEIKKFTNSTPFPVSGNKAKRMKIYKSFKEAEEGYLIMSKEVARIDTETIKAM